jgi:aldehyde dehydrogenase (NAD+)
MARIPNWIGSEERFAASGEWIEKRRPTNGTVLCHLTRSGLAEVEEAIESASAAYPAWRDTTPVARGEVLHALAMGLRAAREEIGQVVAAETGKSLKMALGETDAAIQLGLFFAGEGQRLYGRTTTSGTPNKWASTVRQPLGVAGLIAAANTPIANVAWKLFPALICGNTVVLKAAEDTPATAWIVGRIAREVGIPAGALNVVQGLGREAGAPLVASDRVAVVSFTGSTAVGREIAQVVGRRMGRVSLELGGKNPLVVCDDADLENAAKWVVLSAFSNAGQRCASGSRVIVFESIYAEFRELLIERTRAMRVGPDDADDLGPVINERQLERMLAAVNAARASGARVLVGGMRLTDSGRENGYYMAPTLVEGVDPGHEMSRTELFGPIATLYRVPDFASALELANDADYGLTACIHTRSIHRAIEFTQRVESGVVVVNAGTYGSEPHMPFGGVKQSGNGSREPGTEALDVYSNLKDVYINFDPAQA